MRILIPILGFAPQGGYRVLSELANAWIRLGHECVFLVPSTSPEPYFPTLAGIVRSDRMGNFGTSCVRSPSGADNILSLFAGLRRIAREYDVIVANHSLSAWPVRWSKAAGARKIYYIQAYEPDYYPPSKHPLKHLLARLSYRLALFQISNSSTYLGFGPKPMDVIPPGIDLSIFSPKPNPGIFASSNRIVLGTIGRTEPYKGTAVALDAYRILREEEPQLRMNVGFGNVDPADDLLITSIKSDKELAAYYRSLDILVVSCSGQHGAPHYPLIEAMASGTPVVHTGYYPGTAANSWQAADTSAEAVAAAIRKVISASPEERIAKAIAARQTVAENLSWDSVARRFAGHFNA